ncbi:MAG TPA: DUF1761 domain-containing protein [Candidatus Paceibacterota bacterium]|nr:DUF1761 domain-containing protein [Candidatus Paceibacterota bacterium]
MDVAINYLSVLVAAGAIVGIGTLWYGPLFGKRWMMMKGYTAESMKNMKMSARNAMIFAGIAALVTAFVLALLVRLLNPIGLGGAFMLALLIWTGFIVTTMVNDVLFEEGDVKLFLFHSAERFVALFAAALILVLWP